MTAKKRTLIKNGTVVTASDTFQADVWIEGDRIVGLTDAAQRGNWPTPVAFKRKRAGRVAPYL